MSRVFKVTEESLNSFMSKKYPLRKIVGETVDSYLLKSKDGKGSMFPVRKVDIEAFGINEGYIDVGFKEHTNPGIRGPKEAARADINFESKSSQNRYFANDRVYQSALAKLSPEAREQYTKTMSSLPDDKRAAYAKKLRDTYAQDVYDKNNYAKSAQKVWDEEAEYQENGPKPYGKGVEVKGYKSDSPYNKK